MFRMVFRRGRVPFLAAITGILVLCGILWAPGSLLAQSDLGKISGLVKHPSGATVPNAKVTVRSDKGGSRATDHHERIGLLRHNERCLQGCTG